VANEEVIVVVVAGVAAELNRKEKFDECIKVEDGCKKPILNGYTKA
jgi:hypothetical protein